MFTSLELLFLRISASASRWPVPKVAGEDCAFPLKSCSLCNVENQERKESARTINVLSPERLVS